MMNSLRLRLVLLLTMALGGAWLVAAWFTHNESRSEINRLFDAQLSQSAQVLLETTRHELHERIEHNDNEISVSHEYEQRLAFQIWDESGLLMRSSLAPSAAMGVKKEGYSEAVIDAQPWRVFTRWDIQHEFMIQVAEPLAGRESLARHITFKMLMPTLIALPVLALLIWFGVGAGLQPLKQLKQEVKQRAANRLEPVSLKGVPEEVVPLVDALNDLFLRLQQVFETERRFTADAAHELRTPLAALKVQAQVALRSTAAPERHLALENILRGTDRAARLIEQLLTLARVDPEAATQHDEKVELRGLAALVMAELEPIARAKQIDMALNGDLPCNVTGNRVQLGVMLRNLLDNAIRYTPVNGRVTVSVREQHGVVLEVSDTGPGITVSEREHVQQRFYRIAGSGEEGSGLGLSIVHRIAELHGAQLELCDNASGSGLLVRVSWPPAQNRIT